MSSNFYYRITVDVNGIKEINKRLRIYLKPKYVVYIIMTKSKLEHFMILKIK